MVVGGAGDDSFEMRVLGEKGPLPELQHGNMVYVVAAPGEKFKVQVRNLKRKPALAKASLSVDGKDAGFSKKIVGCMRWNVFDGFWVNPTEKRAFVFSTPSDALDEAEPDTAKRVGVIRVKLIPAEYFPCPGRDCERCQFLGHETHSQDGNGAAKDTEAVLRPDGKKFFMAPSLCVAAGDPVHRHIGAKRVQHTKELAGALFSTLEVRCETADILRLRGVLKPHNPEHARLLPAHIRHHLNIPDPDEGSPDPEPEEQTAAAPGTSRQMSNMTVQASSAEANDTKPLVMLHARDSATASSALPRSAPAVAERGETYVPPSARPSRAAAAAVTAGKRECGAAPPQAPPAACRGQSSTPGGGANADGTGEANAKRQRTNLVDLNFETEEGDDDCAVLVMKKPKPVFVDCESLS